MPVLFLDEDEIMAKETKDSKVYTTEDTDGKGDLGAVGAALTQAGVDADDYKTTGAGVADVARRFAQNAMPKLLSLAELDEEQKRKREEAFVARKELEEAREKARKELEEAVEALQGLDEETLLAYLTALQNLDILFARRELSDAEKDTLKVAQILVENFKTWPVAGQRVVLDGKPDAESPLLRQGFNRWKAEQEKARTDAINELRDVENKKRQQMRGMATETLHGEGDRVVYIDGYYTRMRFDEESQRMIAVTREVDGNQVPQTRHGTFVLTVTGGGKLGQVTEAVNMPFLRDFPHPEKPVTLRPNRNFDSVQRGEPYFHRAVQEMLTEVWSREERRVVSTTMAQLLANGEGRATGHLDNFQSQDRKRQGSITFWVKKEGGRLYLTDSYVSRPPEGKEAFDFSDFPKEGIAFQKEDGEYRAASLVRYILDRMAAEQQEKARYEAAVSEFNKFREEDPDTVEDMCALLDATSKAVYCRYFSWNRGYGKDRVSGMIVMQVKSVGRGRNNRRAELARYFTTNPAFELAVGTEVPASLGLGEDATDAQKALASMLRYCSGRKYEKSVETPGEPDESTGKEDEKVPVGAS